MKFCTALKAAAAGLAVSIPLAQAYVGQMTHYTTSEGSCGFASADTDDVVALSLAVMENGVNPNENPKCGTKISIYNPATGQTNWATIVDSCQGCQEYDIDVSQSLFNKIAPDGNGRVDNIMWGGDMTGG